PDIELLDGDVSRLADRHRADRAPERPRERDGLQRQLVARLDEGERLHATPSCCMTSTTLDAASGPLPRTSARLPWPAGTTRRSFSSFGSRCVGSLAASGFAFARSRP